MSIHVIIVWHFYLNNLFDGKFNMVFKNSKNLWKYLRHVLLKFRFLLRLFWSNFYWKIGGYPPFISRNFSNNCSDHPNKPHLCPIDYITNFLLQYSQQNKKTRKSDVDIKPNQKWRYHPKNCVFLLKILFLEHICEVHKINYIHNILEIMWEWKLKNFKWNWIERKIAVFCFYWREILMIVVVFSRSM